MVKPVHCFWPQVTPIGVTFERWLVWGIKHRIYSSQRHFVCRALHVAFIHKTTTVFKQIWFHNGILCSTSLCNVLLSEFALIVCVLGGVFFS